MAGALALLGLAASGIWAPSNAEAHATPPFTLPAAHATGIRFDTLFVGGHARGSFTHALQVLASELTEEERTLVGQHLDKVFAKALETDGLGKNGRLRVAYERARRPDGSTRSIRVLVAEAAVSGRLHTAYFYEHDGDPGYFDPFGRSLDHRPWTDPVADARVSSPFGMHRLHPILRRVLPHTGVDYAVRRGAPVRATSDGIVAVAGRRGGYGNLVELRHPSGYSTRYAHLDEIAGEIAPTRMVRQGEIIGYVGDTGLATGPHLHYEVRRHGRPVDPTRLTTRSDLATGTANGPDWPRQRRALATLLARTPTLVRSP